jgi:hypothetical protein
MNCKGSTLFEVGVKPLAYNPTGYPYSGCTPAEPASVYPLRYTGGILNALKTCLYGFDFLRGKITPVAISSGVRPKRSTASNCPTRKLCPVK